MIYNTEIREQTYQFPTSIELELDLTQSIFEVGVRQHLEGLSKIALTYCQPSQVELALREQAEILAGLAESLNLPGFEAIALCTLAALEAHPEQAQTILEVALKDFWQGWNAVQSGDRICGGEPSCALQQLAGIILSVSEERR